MFRQSIERIPGTLPFSCLCSVMELTWAAVWTDTPLRPSLRLRGEVGRGRGRGTRCTLLWHCPLDGKRMEPQLIIVS